MCSYNPRQKNVVYIINILPVLSISLKTNTGAVSYDAEPVIDDSVSFFWKSLDSTATFQWPPVLANADTLQNLDSYGFLMVIVLPRRSVSGEGARMAFSVLYAPGRVSLHAA